VSLVLQTWRAIRERDLVELLTHAKNSYLEVSRVEEQIRQGKAYTRDASHGQEQLREIHIPEVEAQFQREEQEIAAFEQEIEQLLSRVFGGACGTSLAAHGMLLSV
jgi:purine nucleoside permease